MTVAHLARLFWLVLVAVVSSLMTPAVVSAAPTLADLTRYDTVISNYDHVTTCARFESETDRMGSTTGNVVGLVASLAVGAPAAGPAVVAGAARAQTLFLAARTELANGVQVARAAATAFSTSPTRVASQGAWRRLIADQTGTLRFGRNPLTRPGPGTGNGIEAAANAGPDLAKGFNSFRAAKRSLPSPGQGNVYDHVVEQSQIAAGRSGFDPQLSHNEYNLNPVPAAVNQAKANYYSSIRPFTGGRTVRDWLNGQSFEQQYSFGVDITSLIQSGATLL